MLLTKEEHNERERRAIYAAVKDEQERERLDNVFGMERINAIEVIRSVSLNQEKKLAMKMKELSLLRIPPMRPTSQGTVRTISGTSGTNSTAT